jgi:hypothetical protein
MTRLMLSFFWFSALAVLAGPPSWPAAPGPERRRPRLTVNTSGNKSFAGEVRRVGKIPWHVREYGRPALAVRADGAVVRGFAWRGSMEGVNVGSHPFTPRAQRARHRAIRVTLDHLWCDDIGEDAVSIQPRAVVTIRHSHFRGNHGRLHTGDSNVRGLDKILQIDSATVILENCVFYDAVSAVRAKTNSRVILKNCQFVNCSTCVSGDGLACPRPGNLYDNGEPGRCLITLINCEAWNCGLLARAYEGCEIQLVDCKTHSTRISRENGGRVRKYRAVRPGNAGRPLEVL